MHMQIILSVMPQLPFSHCELGLLFKNTCKAIFNPYDKWLGKTNVYYGNNTWEKWIRENALLSNFVVLYF